MIKTELTREDAIHILELGKALHQESRFKDSPFSVEACWSVLEQTLVNPEKFFVAFDDQYHGFILMHMGVEFFNGLKCAHDLSLYVLPEYRGSGLAGKLIHAAEEWAMANQATSITINHNTLINPEKAQYFFNKLGFTMTGFIFEKSLTHV